tara:strand:+ start:103 stop:1119 length:1017 start_codon:yes stop_codon:yes gene_type:complete
MSRKDSINSLFLKKQEPAPLSNSGEKVVVERVRTGAISAMESSLQEMAEGAKTAARLQGQLASGDAVVAIDPLLIDGSKISDRLPIDIDPGFDQLVNSIGETGQQVPILVRPHPEVSGRFQVAYGRRRLKAAALLQLPVKAIVRTLTDDELVIAQGRENLDRADLSFIEKAFFALHLEESGFDRATILKAISTDKADLSRYIAVARSIPEKLAQRIGPANKVGRARWVALSECLRKPEAVEKAEEVTSSSEFMRSDSDARFGLLFRALSVAPQQTSRGKTWSTPRGKKVARVEQRDGKTSLIFDEKLVPSFALFISEQLDTLYDQFVKTHEGGADKQI